MLLSVSHKKGFTLIELILVMMLVAILAVALLGNYFSSLKKGRDARRKGDLTQVQKALELYFEDNGTYPVFTDIFGKKLCTTESCSGTDKTYMVKLPTDPNPDFVYKYVPQPTTAPSSPSLYFYLYSYIENSLDSGTNVSQKGYTDHQKCDTSGVAECKFYIGSYNAPPLTPIP